MVADDTKLIMKIDEGNIQPLEVAVNLAERV